MDMTKLIFAFRNTANAPKNGNCVLIWKKINYSNEQTCINLHACGCVHVKGVWNSITLCKDTDQAIKLKTLA
jgi:hypothetical protein